MALVTWDMLPRGTQIRQAAVAILKSSSTLAGSNVIDSPLDEVDEDGLPQINVMSMEDRETLSAAGGPPTFKVPYTLRFQAVVTAAEALDAVLQCDLLAQQIRDALLSDPVFPKLIEAIESFSDKHQGGRGTKRYIVQTIMDLKSAFRETYKPNKSSFLLADGMPQAQPRIVIAPLTTIVDTIATSQPPLSPLLGNFTVTLSSATAFLLQNPDGTNALPGTVGVLYWSAPPGQPGIGFLLAAGSMAFLPGDTFAIAIPGDATPTITPGPNAGNGTLRALAQVINSFAAGSIFT